MTKHKLALVIDLYYPQIGGQQVRFKELCELFVDKGYQVDVFTIDHLGSLTREEVINGVQIYRLYSDKNYYKNGIFGRRLSTFIKFSFKAHRIVNKGNYNTVIYNQFSFISAMLGANKIKNTVIDYVEFRKGTVWNMINRFTLPRVDKVVCISRYLEKEVAEYVRGKSKTRTIPSLVKSSLYRSLPNRELKITFLARLEEHKGLSMAINAVKTYNKRFNTIVKLSIAGDGGLYDEYKTKYIDDLQIEFLGRISEEEKYELLSSSKMLILPSVREGLPKSFIEAVVSDLPIITSNHPDNYGQYFVEGNGIGFVCESLDDYVNAIDSIMNDDSLYKENIKNIKSNFDLEEGANTYIKFIEEQ